MPVENSAEKPQKKPKKAPKEISEEAPKEARVKVPKKYLFLLVFGILGIISGGAFLLIVFLTPKEELAELVFPKLPSVKTANGVYSKLTGLELADASLLNAPAYCIQTPNGTDGARPQAGLNEAGVVFEAIAESGITRYAAIYQNPGSSVIGPIRSLRLYYLAWDTPFDCVIVHAGGADDAIQAVRSGHYKDLSENYTYMYRGDYGYRRWNNLFTNASNLAAVVNDWEFGGSEISGFARMTPAESLVKRVDATAKRKLVITEPADGGTSSFVASVPHIEVYFGGSPTFNVVYDYDVNSNSYNRGFATGDPHEVYKCPDTDLGEVNPEDHCELVQMSPAVVVVMVVEERRADDGYHEDITTTGQGAAWIFQNGYVIPGSWKKKSASSQIKFYDASGAEAKLAPGQTFIEAIPGYGGVEY